MILALPVFALALQPATAGPVRAQSTMPLASLFSDDDYPLDALGRGAEGRVGTRLIVGSNGIPTECKVTESSGDETLDATTCAILMQRARFHPARNARGAAVIDSVSSRINWRLGANLPPGISPYSAYRAAIILAISANGELACALEVNGSRQPSPDRCPSVPPPILAIARQLEPSTQIIVVQSFQPEGGIIAAPAVPYGRLLAETEAELVIDSQGAIESCNTTIRTVHIQGSPTPPDFCASTFRRRYLPGAANRRARVNISVYLGLNRAS